MKITKDLIGQWIIRNVKTKGLPAYMTSFHKLVNVSEYHFVLQDKHCEFVLDMETYGDGWSTMSEVLGNKGGISMKMDKGMVGLYVKQDGNKRDRSWSNRFYEVKYVSEKHVILGGDRVHGEVCLGLPEWEGGWIVQPEFHKGDRVLLDSFLRKEPVTIECVGDGHCLVSGKEGSWTVTKTDIKKRVSTKVIDLLDAIGQNTTTAFEPWYDDEVKEYLKSHLDIRFLIAGVSQASDLLYSSLSDIIRFIKEKEGCK